MIKDQIKEDYDKLYNKCRYTDKGIKRKFKSMITGIMEERNENSCNEHSANGCIWDTESNICKYDISELDKNYGKLKKTQKKVKRKMNTKNKSISKLKHSRLNNLSKKIDSKIRKYKRVKRTNMRSKKKMSTGKGGLKIYKKLKSFLKEPVWSAKPPTMSELGRFTIRGEDDVILLNKVKTKIQEVSDYIYHQVYCSNCNDADGGCVMCHQH